MDANERELFEASLRHATASHTGEALDAAIDELGWPEALVADPQAAVSLLFEQQGGSNATSSALGRVVLAPLELDLDLDLDLATMTGVVLPVLGRCDPPGEVAGDGLTVRGLAGGDLRRRDVAVIVAQTSEDGVTAVTVETKDLALRTIHGFDPGLGLVEVTGDGVRATTLPASPPTAWGAAVVAGQKALAHELVGAARAMLGLARDHAVDRVQFGRPIGSFQAVRPRLADTLVAVEAADAALQVAWEAPSPANAALAKALAGRGALTAARHCQQVLAGIGFTTEHPLHRYVRRARLLDQLLGDARSLTRQLGDDLLATHRLPALLPL